LLFTRCFGSCSTRLTLFTTFFTASLRLRTRFTLAACTFFLLACRGSGFALFSLLAGALRLNASFGFFELLTGVSNVLLFRQLEV